MNEFTEWLRGRVPPDMDLAHDSLAALAAEIGRERQLWEQMVRHDPDQRYFFQLYRDVHVDVWLQCWMNQQDNGFHDHDVSSGAVYVADGVLMEDQLHRDNGALNEASHERPAGSVFDFGPTHIHRIRHPGGPPATSIHVYSPAIWRMGFYEVDPEGNLSRTSITYVDEMGAG